jgi:hypothetical protein
MRHPVAPTLKNGLQQPSFVTADWPQTIRTKLADEIIGQRDSITLAAISGQVAVVPGLGERRTAA